MRRAPFLALALAVLAWPLLERVSPLAAGHPFRSTFAILPLVFAGFWALEVVVRQQGAIAAAPSRGLEVVAVLSLLLLAAAYASLGLAVADLMIAGGLALLLTVRAADTALRMRPLLAEHRTSVCFCLLPLLVYVAIMPWMSGHRQPDGDEPYNLLVAHSLAYDFDAELTNDYQQGSWRRFIDRTLQPQLGDPTGPHGELYSRHNLLLPLFLALPYRVAGLDGALLVMALCTSVLAWRTLALARLYFPERRREALFVYCIVAFAPPLLLYSTQVWVEVPAALLVVLALERIHLIDEAPRLLSWRGLGVILPIALLPLVKIRLMLLALSLLALLWLRSRRHRRAVAALAGMLFVIGCAILMHNQLLYGNPLKVHSLQELNLTRHPIQQYFLGLTGLFFDNAFGLFFAAPAWALLLPAMMLLLWRRENWTLLVDLAVVALPYLAFVAPRSEWYGGWSPPFRYGLAFFPPLAISLVPLLAVRDRGLVRLVALALVVLTLVLSALWVVLPGWTYNWANGTSRLVDHVERLTGIELARLVPSSIRPRPATFIWPLAALAASILLLVPTRRRLLAPLAGAAVLLMPAGLLAYARALPTQRVELEDSFVRKSGGEPYPGQWVVDRPRYRGAWVLPEGHQLRFRVQPGGRKATLRLELRFLRRRAGTMTLALRAGGHDLARRAFNLTTDWTTIELGPFDWPPGEDLVIAALDSRPRGASGRHRVLLDRAEIEWH